MSNGAAILNQQPNIKVFDHESFLKRFPQVKSAHQWAQTEFPPIEWLIEDLLPLGVTAVFGGPPKIGKSLVILNFIAQTIQSDAQCLVYSAEDNGRRMKHRLNEVGLINNHNLLFIAGRTDPIDTNRSHEIFGEMLAYMPRPKLLVLDTLTLSIKHKENRKYDDWCRDLECWNRLAAEFNVTVLTVHHHRKDGTGEGWNDFIGSQGIIASHDTLMSLTRVSGDYNSLTLKVGGKDVQDQELRMEKNGFKYSIVGLEKEESLGAAQAKVYAFICEQGKATWTDVKNYMGYTDKNKSRATAIIKSLLKDNMIEQDGMFYSPIK